MPLQALRPKLLGATTPLALAVLLGFSVDSAQALGLGRPQILSSLGRPLDVAVPLSLAEGEQLTDACLRGEVSAGDARVPAGLLQVRVEGDPGQQRIRLQSLVRIEEPALRITLALGCPVRLTREFNAFVDPAPGPAPAAVPAPAPAPVMVAATVPPPPEPQARVVPEPSAAVVAAAPAPKPQPRPRPVVKPRPAPAAPRLVLEAPEVLVSAAPQKPAASAAEMELTPELEATLAQLEQTVAQLRAELQARQAEAASAASSAMAASAVAAPPPAAPPAVVPTARPSPYRDPMTWLATLGLSLLAGAAAYYLSRWRDRRARRERAYWRALHAAETAEAAARPGNGMAPPVLSTADAVLPDEGQHTATAPQPRPMPWPPQAAAEPTAPAALTTQAAPLVPALPPLRRVQAAATVAASPAAADELLDLQQQLDFLQLLGQHEAAADLLANCITRGGAGAMPYLMLMELCQQRGEPAVFAELASQFEHRFGALAPDWTHSLARGRSLDTCPSVIAHLQVVWEDPAEAMKMLQGLISSGGGPGVPSFDLPACRDLLLLYSVVRDLYEAGLRGDGVDLMLPMDSQL